MTKHGLATTLTFAGSIPFVVLALALAIHLADVNLLKYLLVTYAAIIASFMAGIHWGAYLFKSAPLNLFAHSNILALLAWLSLFLPAFSAYLLLIFCFGYLLVIDHRLFRVGIIQLWYWRLRVRITAIVIVALSFAWLVSA